MKKAPHADVTGPRVRAPLAARLVATFGYTGFFPVAPATLASLLVAVIYFGLPAMTWPVQAALLVAVSWIGVITSTMTEKELGHDAGPIVIDEVAGMIVTYLLVTVPAAGLPRIAVLLAGFVFFRIFDIVKPWPAAQLQNLPAGRGIVADDLMAGVYANIALRLVILFGPRSWFHGAP